MRKVLSFSGFLMLGLVVSQFLPMMAGDGYGAVKSISNVLLYVCLSFIMINVGREFVLDKTRWKSYAQDYFIAMATAALPWFMIAIYYVFILLPILTPIILIQSLPADRQKQEHNHHHNNQLPAQPDHHNLKRNH